MNNMYVLFYFSALSKEALSSILHLNQKSLKTKTSMSQVENNKGHVFNTEGMKTAIPLKLLQLRSQNQRMAWVMK